MRKLQLQHSRLKSDVSVETLIKTRGIDAHAAGAVASVLTDDIVLSDRLRIECRVADMRIKLDLMPWEEQILKAREYLEKAGDVPAYGDPGRRSGRTTRGMLYALACCVELSKSCLVIEYRGSHYTGELTRTAIVIAQRLQLMVRIHESSHREILRQHPDTVIYSDHHKLPT